jgi:hypothetical protein
LELDPGPDKLVYGSADPDLDPHQNARSPTMVPTAPKPNSSGTGYGMQVRHTL